MTLDDVRPARREFLDQDLSGALFDRCDLTGAVVRGSAVGGLELDDPWLARGGGLLVNGVDVVAYVESELDRRFPGRSLRSATDAAGLRAAWEAVSAAWASALARAESLPDGSVHARVAGEWSFAQTLRHLVTATDLWFGRSIRGLPAAEALHPWGLPHAEYATDGYDTSVFTDPPSYAAVLEVRAERQTAVGAFLADLTDDDLARPALHLWSPGTPRQVLQSLHTILGEEWEHLRFALRDLDAVERGEGLPST